MRHWCVFTQLEEALGLIVPSHEQLHQINTAKSENCQDPVLAIAHRELKLHVLGVIQKALMLDLPRSRMLSTYYFVVIVNCMPACVYACSAEGSIPFRYTLGPHRAPQGPGGPWTPRGPIPREK